MTKPRYRLIDHTADMAFDVEGADWPGLLAEATRAVADIVREEGAEGEETLAAVREISVSGADREDVLVAWLTEVVVLFEDQGFLGREARFSALTETSARGTLRGRELDFAVESPDRVIKAVTYHDLAVVPGREGAPWRVTIVLDL